MYYVLLLDVGSVLYRSTNTYGSIIIPKYYKYQGKVCKYTSLLTCHKKPGPFDTILLGEATGFNKIKNEQQSPECGEAEDAQGARPTRWPQEVRLTRETQRLPAPSERLSEEEEAAGHAEAKGGTEKCGRVLLWNDPRQNGRGCA